MDDDELPSTLQRSDAKARATFAKTHDSAEDTYADAPNTEEIARRTAFAALKHTHEKVGDHWEPKEGGRTGPSDARAAGGVDSAGGADSDRPTAGGVDTAATKEHLLGLARRLGVPGRSRMTKAELVEALQKANDKETARAREGS